MAMDSPTRLMWPRLGSPTDSVNFHYSPLTAISDASASRSSYTAFESQYHVRTKSVETYLRMPRYASKPYFTFGAEATSGRALWTNYS